MDSYITSLCRANMNAVDITGIWKIKITSTGGTQTALGSKWSAFITANQTGTTISGIFETVYGLSGDVTGSVSRDEISMTIEQGPPRPGTFSGVAKVNETCKKMRGTYTGADSAGTLQASFNASKITQHTLILERWLYKVIGTVGTVVAGIISITSVLAVYFSVKAAILFFKQSSIVLCAISMMCTIASLLSVFMWLFGSWMIGSNDDIDHNSLLIWDQILSLKILACISINIISILLLIYANGVRFSWLK